VHHNFPPLAPTAQNQHERKSTSDPTAKELRVIELPDGRLFVMMNFSDKNASGIRKQQTVWGAVFKGFDYDTGKTDAHNPAPFAPCALEVRPFAKQDRGSQWAHQAFAWRYTGEKCTTSAALASALQDHWVCSEVGGRILVAVTDCGVLPLSWFFTDYQLHSMEKEGGVYSKLSPAQWYGAGESKVPKEVVAASKRRKLAF